MKNFAQFSSARFELQSYANNSIIQSFAAQRWTVWSINDSVSRDEPSKNGQRSDLAPT